jgi:hypothetical protein
MSVMPWMIKAWPMLEWYLPMRRSKWPEMGHAQTRMRPGRDAFGRRVGDTVWLGTLNGRSAGLAFEWVELREGVVALADPNSITSNIRFLNSNNTYLEPLSTATALNRLAHSLPWQRAVCEAIAGEQALELAA